MGGTELLLLDHNNTEFIFIWEGTQRRVLEGRLLISLMSSKPEFDEWKVQYGRVLLLQEWALALLLTQLVREATAIESGLPWSALNEREVPVLVL